MFGRYGQAQLQSDSQHMRLLFGGDATIPFPPVDSAGAFTEFTSHRADAAEHAESGGFTFHTNAVCYFHTLIKRIFIR